MWTFSSIGNCRIMFYFAAGNCPTHSISPAIMLPSHNFVNHVSTRVQRTYCWLSLISLLAACKTQHQRRNTFWPGRFLMSNLVLHFSLFKSASFWRKISLTKIKYGTCTFKKMGCDNANRMILCFFWVLGVGGTAPLTFPSYLPMFSSSNCNWMSALLTSDSKHFQLVSMFPKVSMYKTFDYDTRLWWSRAGLPLHQKTPIFALPAINELNINT